MDKTTQDLAWACLPKEARDEIRKEYQAMLNKQWYCSAYLRGRLRIMREIYGEHNLTSDTEPEEMLMVKRKSITNIYEANERIIDGSQWSEDYKDKVIHVNSLFETLFGDKCLPDKELNEDNFAKSEPSVQGEPKFEVGQQVKIVKCTHPEYIDKVGIITSIDTCGNPYVKVEGLGSLKHAPFALEPYTEPEKGNNEEKQGNNSEIPNHTKDMEEKELNLAELLKGCEGEKFFSPNYGEVILIGNEKYLEFRTESGSILTSPLNIPTVTGYINYYPSKDVYLKYPLDAKKAWEVWASERKPKRWRAKSSAGVAVSECEGHWEDYTYWYITSDGVIADDEETGCQADTLRYNFGNYFRTEEEAQQAAEAVRECLEKFHERANDK